jgi:type I restriction enzyme S subunit
MKTELLKKLGRINTIPAGWKLTTVGKVCKIRNDLRKPLSTEERAKIQGAYPYYGPTGVLDFIDHHLVEGQFALIGEDGDHFLKPEQKAQTLLVNGKFNINNHAHLIQGTEKCSSEWFFLYFHHRDITHLISRQGASRYKLNKDTLSKLPILVPPLNEQLEIYKLFTTWDNAIEKTEALIAAKEKQFEWLMEKLFKPNDTWTPYRLGELFDNRKESNNTDLPLISITRDKGVIPHSETNRKDNSSEDKSKYLRIRPNDIGYNTMRMWQGVSALSGIDGIVSPAYTICIPKKIVDPEFMAFLFKTKPMIHKFYRYSQGLTSDTWNLKFHHFCEVKAEIADIETQVEIAQILNTAKHEIDLIKKTLEQYRSQKRGLMQKLLTGEWQVSSTQLAAEGALQELSKESVA